jgi:hypothetical protein
MRAKPLLAVVLLAFSVALAPAVPVRADDEIRRHGSCEGGPGEWTLRVRRESRTTLRVRFRIEDAVPGHTWQLFLSDNGVRVFARSKVADEDGGVRVRTLIRNRAGVDRIKASGVDLVNGETCTGGLRY